MSDAVRIDKWLWAVRIFKSRSQAKDACLKNNVSINDKKAKPSQDVTVGNIVKVKKNGFNYEFQVEQIIAKRVGFSIAKDCYIDLTPEEELKKYSDWFVGKNGTERREKGAGRPTKRERREITDFKDNRF